MLGIQNNAPPIRDVWSAITNDSYKLRIQKFPIIPLTTVLIIIVTEEEDFGKVTNI